MLICLHSACLSFSLPLFQYNDDASLALYGLLWMVVLHSSITHGVLEIMMVVMTITSRLQTDICLLNEDVCF